jgi:hypothetical protein
MMQSITKTVPKHKHLCGTVVGKGRTYLVVSYNSVGPVECYRRLCERLGILFTDAMLASLQLEERRKGQHNALKSSATVKRKRFKEKHEKINKELLKQIKDEKNGLSYESGVAGPKSKCATEGKRTRRRKSDLICKDCFKPGHGSKNAKKCCHLSKGNAGPLTAEEAGKGPLVLPYTGDMDELPFRQEEDNEKLSFKH